MRRDRLLKIILTAWGLLCLFFAVLYTGLAIWAAGGSGRYFYPGNTGLPEWIGMGLLSLGLARLLDRPE